MDSEDSVLELSHILILAKSVHVPEFSEGQERPLTDSDFQAYRDICEKNLININNCLRRKLPFNQCGKNERPARLEKDNRLAVVHLLIVCGEHSALDQWTTEASLNSAYEISRSISTLLNEPNIEKVLLAGNRSLFRAALIELRPRLLSKTWKSNPAAVLCYCWLLTRIEFPHLGDHLNDILPTALMLIDDFESSNRIKGLECINHIVNNVTRADLEMYGQNDVILEGLRSIFYLNDLEVLKPLLKCFVSLLQKMESNRIYCNLDKNKFDDVFATLLANCDLEDRFEHKATYLKSLPEMIALLRLRTLRHSRNLFEMIARELNTEASDDMNEHLLDVLDAAIVVCWPRCNVEKQCRPVLISVLKLLHDLSSLPGNAGDDCTAIVKRIKQSVYPLKHLCQNQLELISMDIKRNDNLPSNFKRLVDFIL